MVDLPDSDSPPPPKRRPGRQPKDWDGLFAEWLKSGLPKRDFLIAKGMDPRGGTVSKRVAGWEDALAEARDRLTHQHIASTVGGKVAAVVDNVLSHPSGQLPPLGESPQQQAARIAGDASRPQASWQKVQDWRGRQVDQDWKTSDQIRMHISLILKHAVQKVVTKDEAGNIVKDEYVSSLRPAEVRALAMAAAEVQRIQRLALGLSTDNIGIDAQVETHIDGQLDGDDTKPANLFVVELTKGGKFVRARPRRAG